MKMKKIFKEDEISKILGLIENINCFQNMSHKFRLKNIIETRNRAKRFDE